VSARLALALVCLGAAPAARASEIELSWPPAPPDAAGELAVERRTPGGTWLVVKRLPLSATGWIDSGLARESTWCYRVRLSRGKESPLTHAAEFCVGPGADSAPPPGKRVRVRGGWLQEVEP
jgi:hypothetical protein